MKDLIASALKFENNILKLLDQRLLPQQEQWLTCNTIDDVIDAIKLLKVRGAPLIGVTAVVALAKLLNDGASSNFVEIEAKRLRQARPTAVNLMNCIDRFLNALERSTDQAIQEAESIFVEDVALCNAIASHGFELIKDKKNIMTYCNTGGLATAGRGTALGIISFKYEQESDLHIYVNETRPLLQGARLTAWELTQNNIPHTLICDNMAATLMQQGKVDCVIVGADRIAKNGDFANKIGTYNLAILANFHGVPFYVAAPITTFDPECESGKQIEIEQRHQDEVRGIHGHFGKIVWSPENSEVFNPSFDVTPSELVTAYVFDKGIFCKDSLSQLIFSK